MGWEVKGPIIDTMVTAALVDENRRSYSLNNLSIEMLGEMKSETELKEESKRKEVWMLRLSYGRCLQWQLVFMQNKMLYLH